jgi:hypothetical protein
MAGAVVGGGVGKPALPPKGGRISPNAVHLRRNPVQLNAQRLSLFDTNATHLSEQYWD